MTTFYLYRYFFFCCIFPVALVASFSRTTNRQSITTLFAAERRAYALLVDAENASNGTFDLAMKYLQESRNGLQMPIRRIYGKAGILSQGPWQTMILEHSLIEIPTHHLGIADIDLVIDAMDLLYTKESFLEGFVLFSSDADFTRLAQRIREQNLIVIGVGRRLASQANGTLAKACHEFVYMEDLEEQMEQMNTAQRVKEKEAAELPQTKKLETEEEDTPKDMPTEENTSKDTSEEEDAAEEKSLEIVEQKEVRDRTRMRKVWATLRKITARTSEKLQNMSPQNSTSLCLEMPVANATLGEGRVVPEGIPAATNSAAVGKVVRRLKRDVKRLSPSNEWLMLSVLTEASPFDVKAVGYKKKIDLMRAQNKYFELKLKGTSWFVRLRK